MSTIMNQQQYSSTSNDISNRKIIGQRAKKMNLANPQSSNRIISASPPSLETSVANKNRKLKSWRSSGWAPLSYPSLALYSHEHSTTTITTNPSNTHRDITNPSANANAINPFFPLHKDVILAAARELFILDKAIESSTMETNTTMDAIKNRKEKGMIDINSNHGDINLQGLSNQKQTAAHDDDTKDPQTHENQISFSSFSEKESDKNHLLIRKRKRRGSGKEGITLFTPVTTTNTNAGTVVKAVIINEKVKLKPSHHSHHTTDTENSNDDEHANDKKNNSNLTAETLTNLVLQNILNNLFRDDQISSHVKEKETSTLALASNNPTTTPTMDHNSNRIRKVSDAGMDAPSVSSTSAFAPLPMPATSCSTALTSTSTQSPYAAHLAVVAINLSGFEDAIEHVDIDANDFEKKLLLSLQLKNQMPQMLDLSIMVEAHLRKIALRMVYSFRDFVSDKALREFLGYKTAKNGRVLELISDFLFDVSHAMFAWEKTEKDMYGNKSTNTTVVDYKSHDSTICKALFDNRALRKIGGFEQTSLLTHALSIKRLRASGESWATSANTTAGKQMMLHHRDNSSRVRAGAKRRDKRTKKNICTILDEKDNNKSRSSSIISMDRRGNDGTNGAELKILTDSLYNDVSILRVQPSCISPVHDLIPITITREEGKSWGILLAREGSMCAVMRVPDSPEHQLQRGDLIVSICNEDQERVNTPTLHSSNTVSPEWFSEAVGIFKRSNALQLEIRRVHSPTSKVDA